MNVDQARKIVLNALDLPEDTKLDPVEPFNQQGFDSLDMVEIVHYVEDNYDVIIEDSDASELTSLTALSKFLEKHDG